MSISNTFLVTIKRFFILLRYKEYHIIKFLFKVLILLSFVKTPTEVLTFTYPSLSDSNLMLVFIENLLRFSTRLLLKDDLVGIRVLYKSHRPVTHYSNYFLDTNLSQVFVVHLF